jgi:hypothetical protein
LVNELGGVAAAKRLVNDQQISDGFQRLWDTGRLDLTVEYVVAHERRFSSLFTPGERLAARKRYEEYKRQPPP